MRKLFTLGIGCLLWNIRTAFAQPQGMAGATSFQLYGGGAALSGHYDRPGVDSDERKYADAGGLIGGEFLYYVRDSPTLAFGVDISHAGFDDHDSTLLLPHVVTASSAQDTAGLAVARLAFPIGRVRPYVQAGVGLHQTSLTLKGVPFNGFGWTDTNTSEERRIYDDGHVGPALSGAVGLHVYLTEQFFIGAEYRFIALIGKDFEPTAEGRREGLAATDGSVSESGIGFMLGFGF
jgi:opacity protein-like surface antigen